MSIIYNILDQYIIYNKIILESNISTVKIIDIYSLIAVLSSFSLILSGFIFDKFGRKILFKLSILLSIITLLLLILSSYKIFYIYIYALLSPISNNFTFGKNEASLYQSTKYELKNINLFPKILSYFYGITDLIKLLGAVMTGILISFGDKNLINIVLSILIVIKIFIFFITKNIPNIEQSNAKISILNLAINNIKQNKQIQKRILIFGYYTSIMYIYKEFITIATRVYEQDFSKIIFFKSIYHSCMAIGCIIPILISKILIKNKTIFIHFMPIFLIFAMFLASILQNYYGVMYCICAISLSFCAFEISSDFDIDTNINPQILGLTNSIIWFTSSAIGAIMSCIMSILARIIDEKYIISIILTLYLCIALILYYNVKIKDK